MKSATDSFMPDDAASLESLSTVSQTLFNPVYARAIVGRVERLSKMLLLEYSPARVKNAKRLTPAVVLQNKDVPMDVYEAIKTRRTIRNFEDRPVALAVIEKIIAAGLQAPSNDHMRNWEFVIVREKEQRARLLKVEDLTDRDACDKMLDDFGMSDEVQRSMYHQAMPRQFSMLYSAGCLILPFFKVDTPLLHPKSLSDLNDFASMWCCIENILLAAASEGIFGVTRIPMTEESEHIKNIVGHPDCYVMPCYIALGYPAKNVAPPAQKAVHVQDKIHINFWNGVG